MPGNGHDRPCAVSHQNIIRNPDGNVASCRGVRHAPAGPYAGLLRLDPPLHVAFPRRLLLVFFDGLLLRGNGHPRDQRMFRSKNHVGSPEERIRSRGKDAHLLVDRTAPEIDLRPFGAADPIPLLFQRRRRPVQVLCIFQQAFRVSRDTHHPLFHRAPFDRISFIGPFGHLLVCQHGPQPFAPVHRNLGNERQAKRRENFLLSQLRHPPPFIGGERRER